MFQFCLFFVVKKKAAYEMRISDWSSDVCSSDLDRLVLGQPAVWQHVRDYVKGVFADVLPDGWLPEDKAIYVNPTGLFEIGGPDGDASITGRKSGRASWRERVGQ